MWKREHRSIGENFSECVRFCRILSHFPCYCKVVDRMDLPGTPASSEAFVIEPRTVRSGSTSTCPAEFFCMCDISRHLTTFPLLLRNHAAGNRSCVL